jgi:hypothetical protein
MFPNEIAAPDARHNTSLIAIGPRRCRYIVSDTTRDAVCCGAPTIAETSSWCLYHALRVYEPRLTRAEREERREQQRRAA